MRITAVFSWRVFLAAAAAAVIGAGVAYATIPDSSNVIHACLSRLGTVRLIDTEAGAGCRKAEAELQWYSTSGSEGLKAADAELLDGFDSAQFLQGAFVEVFRTGDINPARPGKGVVSATRVDTGYYRVTFAEDVSRCTYFASTPYNAETLAEATQVAIDAPNTVTVFTYGFVPDAVEGQQQWPLADRAFDLAALCA